VDISQPRIDAWNSDKLPIYEPRLDDVVLEARCVPEPRGTACRASPAPSAPPARRPTPDPAARARRPAQRPRWHTQRLLLTRSPTPSSGRNLFFSTDVKKHIAEADVIFVR